MQPHLAFHVRQFPIASVTDAARIARLRESSLHHTPPKYTKPNPTTKHYVPFTNKPTLPSPDYPKPPPQHPNIPTPPNNQRPPRRFSYEEMQDRRSKGLCMFCDEQYSPGHHLKHKRSQIFVLETEDADTCETDEFCTAETCAEDPLDTPPVISLNALEDIATFHCMRVIGQVAKQKFHLPLTTVAHTTSWT